MNVPLTQPWNGYVLIKDERIPPDQYVVTSVDGVMLAGGNLETGGMWRNNEPGAVRLEGHAVRASEPVVKRLMDEASQPAILELSAESASPEKGIH